MTNQKGGDRKMSSCNYSAPCPKCGESMDMYTESRPYDTASGQCLYCGFYFYPKEDRLTLAEVNEARTDGDLKPLKELKAWED